MDRFWTEVEGLDKLMAQLKKMPEKAKRTTLLKIMRRVTGPVADAARAEVAQIQEKAFSEGRFPTGNLYDSIGNITGRSKEFPNIQIGPRAKGNYKGWHGHLVHYGTGQRTNKYGQNRGAVRANPYMERAFKKTFPSVKPNFEKEVAREVERIAKETLKPTV